MLQGGIDERGKGAAYSVVCTLVHMNTLEALTSCVEVEIETPQSSTERVGQPRTTLVVQGIVFAEYRRRSGLVTR